MAAIFRAHDWTKSSLEWSRGVEVESGCMPCEEDRREGRCSLRSLTPRYNRAGCTEKIMAVNLWTDSIGFHLSPFLVATLHRDIASFRFHPLAWSHSSFLSLSFCLHQEKIQNRYIIAYTVYDFPSKHLCSFQRKHKVMIIHTRNCKTNKTFWTLFDYYCIL